MSGDGANSLDGISVVLFCSSGFHELTENTEIAMTNSKLIMADKLEKMVCCGKFFGFLPYNFD